MTERVFPPWKWGPIYWRYLRTLLETASDEQAKTTLVPAIRSFTDSLPCASCKTHFDVVLKKYPPEKYVMAGGEAGRASRLAWFDLVREEVRRHEAPKTLDQWLSRNRPELVRAIGFVLFLIIAAFIGALVLRRCMEKGVVAPPIASATAPASGGRRSTSSMRTK